MPELFPQYCRCGKVLNSQADAERVKVTIMATRLTYWEWVCKDDSCDPPPRYDANGHVPY